MRAKSSLKNFFNFFSLFACIENADLIYYLPMGQQLRTRAKRARRIARNKRAHAKLLAAKKK
jgi:hypothetical protein